MNWDGNNSSLMSSLCNCHSSQLVAIAPWATCQRKKKDSVQYRQILVNEITSEREVWWIRVGIKYKTDSEHSSKDKSTYCSFGRTMFAQILASTLGNSQPPLIHQHSCAQTPTKSYMHILKIKIFKNF